MSAGFHDEAPAQRHILVFDVNETLLDIGALDPLFEQWFGSRTVRRVWFSQMIQSALVSIVTGAYVPFGQVGMAALEMVAAQHGLTLNDSHRNALRQGMVSLLPHPEVPVGLQRLGDAGFRLVALTNSTQQVVENQLTYAGLAPVFERIFSADSVKRLKPAPEPYHMVAREMGVSIEQTRLIAAHAWDVAGALRAGCAAAFVARPGMVLDPLAPHPDVVGKDLTEIAALLIPSLPGAGSAGR